ncbi:MAG: ribosomal RNA small subunit methyltransferase A [Candidatus Bathyarchaeota archaeon]|nr:MAG: ribosomal RNA small subunit methyltransferase A [Candidatus Bathyarchaeota archaeon]
MSLLQRTKRLLHLYRFSPKKRLGQNFVVDTDLLQRLIGYGALAQDDVVLEVGAGLGFLTRFISSGCKKVISVEVDRELMKLLGEQLHDLQNVDLIEGDILKVSIPQFNKVISTPPYSISSLLLFWLLELKFDCAVLTFQKEFAERLVASVGSRSYGRLTVTAYYRAEIELLEYVSREMFYPPPDVDSAIVRLRPRASPFEVEDEEVFLDLVRTLFTQRNKKVRNSIIPFLQKRGLKKRRAVEVAEFLVFHEKRARKLAPEDFGALSNEIIRNL